MTTMVARTMTYAKACDRTINSGNFTTSVRGTRGKRNLCATKTTAIIEIRIATMVMPASASTSQPDHGGFSSETLETGASGGNDKGGARSCGASSGGLGGKDTKNFRFSIVDLQLNFNMHDTRVTKLLIGHLKL